MTSLIKKMILAAALAATALAGSAPAMAHGYYGGEGHHDGDGAGVAIGAGIVGLALGAIIASNAHHHDRYDNRYYADGGYYDAPQVQPYWTWHDGYYWDRDGNRYDHEYRGYDRRGYGGNTYGGEYRDHGYGHDGDRRDGGEQRRYEGGRGY